MQLYSEVPVRSPSIENRVRMNLLYLVLSFELENELFEPLEASYVKALHVLFFASSDVFCPRRSVRTFLSSLAHQMRRKFKPFLSNQMQKLKMPQSLKDQIL